MEKRSQISRKHGNPYFTDNATGKVGPVERPLILSLNPKLLENRNTVQELWKCPQG